MGTKQEQLEGMWEQARGRIREAWGALTDDDLNRAAGRWDQLVGVIRQRTGESLEKVESTLKGIRDRAEEARPKK